MTNVLPELLDCWIRTDLAGQILDIDPTCPRLLNLTARGAKNRQLTLFFPGSHHALMSQLFAAGREVPSPAIAASFRARDRKPIQVLVSVARLDNVTVEWRVRGSESDPASRAL